MQQLGFNFSINDLYSANHLKSLYETFLRYLKEKDEKLYEQYQKMVSTLKEEDEVIMQVALYVQSFILELFNIKDDFIKLQGQNSAFALIKATQKQFINKYVKLYNQEELQNLNIVLVKKQLLQFLNLKEFNQFVYAKHVLKWLENKEEYQKELDCACKYGAYAFFTNEGKKEHKNDFIFFKAQKVDFNNLLLAQEQLDVFNSYTISNSESPIIRQDFSLHDKNDDLTKAVFQSNYCVHCHFRGRDYCSKGQTDNENLVKQNPLGNKLSGCPLNMHISQMHYFNANYNTLAGFIVALINNPMVAGTGHRICNDCTTSCIYQKQEAVDTPKAESIILKQIINLPFGFEVYSLLTRWNPCNIKSPYMKTKSGKKVLVVGSGPAGYTLSHYLLMQGHEVLCIDGTKIEKLPKCFTVDEENGSIQEIKNVATILEPLENRTIYGFGGVSEYGITARWDKNYLTIIRIILERNPSFELLGGCAFGANINYKNAKELGFDHIAFCTGAGKSNTLNIENSLAKGVKLSSDFLMNLHLSSATLENMPTFLQVKMPIVVIGGGLTAIDVATESYVYYIKLVQKVAKQYSLLSSNNKKSLTQSLSYDDLQTLKEYLHHNELFEQEKARAKALTKKPNFKAILDSLGGVKVVYRKDIKESPAYKLNSNELNYALREGVEVLTKLTPIAFNTNKEGLYSITFNDEKGNKHEFKAKTAVLALGNTPNKSNNAKNMEFSYSQSGYLKPLKGYSFISGFYEDIAISFFGDTNFKYKGSVVKAMASAKDGSLEIKKLLQNKKGTSKLTLQEIKALLTAKVVSVKEVAEDVFEIIVNSKIAASNFKAGQFFKLQSYNNKTLESNNLKFTMEPIALTGASVNKQNGNIKLYVLKAGVSTSLVKYLKPNQELVLMGPNGNDLNLPNNKKVLLVGGGLGNAVLPSLIKELQSNNNHVSVVAGYKKASQVFAKNDLKSNSTLFCVEDLTTSFVQERGLSFIKGNIIDGINFLNKNSHSSLKDIDYIINIGSSSMMEAVNNFVNKNKNILFKKDLIVKCELNSLMSCMMKEICGSCVQKIHINGSIKYVYACSHHCHNANNIDFNFLQSRLKQNILLEKLSSILLNEKGS